MAEHDNDVFFASEAKAILSVLPECRAFETAGVAQFLTFGCTIDGKTLFNRVNMLPGGSLWAFDRHGVSKRQYFTPSIWEQQPV
ncbi:hypothetical protein, partial [Salmonella sp. SAL4449]|uniref:hypothetical protein n=1 Tax=Salmonella sp. SAL4449 TaxID=3159904 RepID=UPI003979DE8B